MTGEPAGDNAADVTFADNMIAQDQQGIAMSTLVPDRSTTAEVLAFAKASASARQSELAILKVLEVQWNVHQDNQSSAGHGPATGGLIDQATIAKIQSLHGGAFEKLWLQSMIDLDTSAVAIANAEIADGKNVDALDVAKQLAEARRAEIGQMKGMLGG